MSLTNYLALKLAIGGSTEPSTLAVVVISVALVVTIGFVGYVLWTISNDKV